jgi:hypothetical protein
LGRCSMVSFGESASTNMLSTQFRNWRTFPGHGYERSQSRSFASGTGQGRS